ncbi:MAG: hypothetical protein WA130_01875 [Candidatus Methanoperedens sp.]
MVKRNKFELGRFSYETEIKQIDPKIAEKLNIEFNLNAKHSRYHIDGTFYNPLDGYPAVLFDLYGYIFLESEEDIKKFETERINIHRGIHTLKNYIKYSKVPKSIEDYEMIIKEKKKKDEKIKEEKLKKFEHFKNIMLNAVKQNQQNNILKL